MKGTFHFGKVKAWSQVCCYGDIITTIYNNNNNNNNNFISRGHLSYVQGALQYYDTFK